MKIDEALEILKSLDPVIGEVLETHFDYTELEIQTLHAQMYEMQDLMWKHNRILQSFTDTLKMEEFK